MKDRPGPIARALYWLFDTTAMVLIVGFIRATQALDAITSRLRRSNHDRHE
jgi:hypothetical protein